jgi:hypothetical protein
MNPYRARTINCQIAERWKGKTESLPQIGKIFSVAQALNEPIRQEEKSREAHEKAVNEIH